MGPKGMEAKIEFGGLIVGREYGFDEFIIPALYPALDQPFGVGVVDSQIALWFSLGGGVLDLCLLAQDLTEYGVDQRSDAAVGEMLG